METVLGKGKFHQLFDAAFVSVRAAQSIDSESFNSTLKKGATVGVENAKFMIPLSKSEREIVNSKIDELAAKHNWRKMAGQEKSIVFFFALLYSNCALFHCIVDAPVYRRRRDERDLQDDVFFFIKPAENASSEESLKPL